MAGRLTKASNPTWALTSLRWCFRGNLDSARPLEAKSARRLLPREAPFQSVNGFCFQPLRGIDGFVGLL